MAIRGGIEPPISSVTGKRRNPWTNEPWSRHIYYFFPALPTELPLVFAPKGWNRTNDKEVRSLKINKMFAVYVLYILN